MSNPILRDFERLGERLFAIADHAEHEHDAECVSTALAIAFASFTVAMIREGIITRDELESVLSSHGSDASVADLEALERLYDLPPAEGTFDD